MNKIRIITLLVLLILALLFMGFSFLKNQIAQSNVQELTHLINFTNGQYGFSIQIPRDWIIKQGYNGAIVLFADTRTVANMNIYFYEENETLSKYVLSQNVSPATLAETGYTYTALSGNYTSVDGLEAYRKIYLFGGTSPHLTTKQEQYIIKYDDGFYVITCSDAPDFFNETFFETIVSTFKVTR